MKKRVASALLALAMLVSASVFPVSTVAAEPVREAEAESASENQNNISWSVDKNYVLRISGTGEMPDLASYEDQPWYADNTKVVSVVIGEGITHIGNNSFMKMEDVMLVIYPSTLKSIGDSAFNGCTSLEEIVLPEGVERIGARAFYNCSAVQEVSIPDAIEYVGDYAFEVLNTECYKYEHGTYYLGNKKNPYLVLVKSPTPTNVSSDTEYWNDTEYWTVEVVDGVRCIMNNAFEVKIDYIILPSTLVYIGNYAFAKCNQLSRVSIPDSVREIGTKAFSGCHLGTVKLPENLVKLGSYAFYGCQDLYSVTVGSLLDADGYGYKPFFNCSSLKSFSIREKNSNLTFKDGLVYGKNNTVVLDSILGYNFPQKVVVLPTVKVISKDAIYDCLNIKDLILPEGLETIEAGGISYCSNISELILPDSLTTLEKNAINLNAFSITVGKSLKNIADGAFNLNKLRFVYNNSENIEFSEALLGTDAYGGLLKNSPTVFTGKSTTFYVGDFKFVEVNGEKYLIKYLGKNTKVVLPTLPTGEKYTVMSNAFFRNNNIVFVDLSDSVKALQEHAFYCLKSLLTVDLGSSLTSLNKYDFYGCENVTDIIIHRSTKRLSCCSFYENRAHVRYLGSKGEWNKVQITDENEGYGNCWGKFSYSFYCESDKHHTTTVIVKNPTCKEAGKASEVCEICGLTTLTNIPLGLRHAYVDGKCSVCGVELKYGDTNNDGKSNSFDLYQMSRYINGHTVEGFFDIDGAEINGDGKINALDLADVRAIISGN